MELLPPFSPTVSFQFVPVCSVSQRPVYFAAVAAVVVLNNETAVQKEEAGGRGGGVLTIVWGFLIEVGNGPHTGQITICCRPSTGPLSAGIRLLPRAFTVHIQPTGRLAGWGPFHLDRTTRKIQDTCYTMDGGLVSLCPKKRFLGSMLSDLKREG